MTTYLRLPVLFTGIALALAFLLGLQSGLSTALSFLLIGSVLAVLEISLSFDNAIVNANKLKTMTPEWQRRFLTWGILIAVFGMRVIFPLAIVVVAARIGPLEAISLAASRPDEYARIMHEAHLGIAAFGGTFLMMVALDFFIDGDKDVHWFHALERKLAVPGRNMAIQVGVVVVAICVVFFLLPDAKAWGFAKAAVFGLITYLGVSTLGRLLDRAEQAKSGAAKGGFGAFLYLEMLDASFSFDGVIGAFALTNNLFLIAIGLGIGAFYVRALTIMLVERGTLSEFRYLEHGAFYSIFALSIIMYLQAFFHVPEVITGLIGAALIGTSFYASLRARAAEAP